MKQSIELHTSYDYSAIERNGEKNYRVKLLGLDILHCTISNFARGEKMEVSLHCLANAPVRDIGFRLEFYYKDGSIAGSALTRNKVSVEADTKFDVHLEIDTANFAPGRYYAIVLAYEEDGDRHQLDTDRVEPGMIFEIIDSEVDSLKWLHPYWGHTRYNDLRISQVKLIE